MGDDALPYGGITRDPHLSNMKDCLGAIIVWSSKFATYEMRGNQPFFFETLDWLVHSSVCVGYNSIYCVAIS
jgi:hypothetical protein